MSGQLTGIHLATILDLCSDCPYSDHRYEERELRAACFSTWSLFHPGVSRQPLQARAAVCARFRKYEVEQAWWAHVSASGTSSPTLTRTCSRSCSCGKKTEPTAASCPEDAESNAVFGRGACCSTAGLGPDSDGWPCTRKCSERVVYRLLGPSR